MRANPLTDILHFITHPAWTTAVFWILMIASLGIAIYCLATLRTQRKFGHVANWLFRISIGAMWWQQTLWKLPPAYTEDPSSPFGTSGLPYWMSQMVKGAAFQVHADIVDQLLLPHFYLVAPFVYAAEVLTAVSLMLGLFVRLGGLLGALQLVNLWLGLYNAPGEWPWTYFFLLVLQLIFAVHRYGRSLGLDALIISGQEGEVKSPTVCRALIDAAT